MHKREKPAYNTAPLFLITNQQRKSLTLLNFWAFIQLQSQRIVHSAQLIKSEPEQCPDECHPKRRRRILYLLHTSNTPTKKETVLANCLLH